MTTRSEAYLVDQTSIDEQIAVAGGMGWQTPAMPSLNKERTSVVDDLGYLRSGGASRCLCPARRHRSP